MHSQLWNLNTLSKVELKIPHIFESDHKTIIPGLVKLVKESKSLRHLKISLTGVKVEDEDLDDDGYDDDDTVELPVDIIGDQLFRLEELCRLESLDLEGIITYDKESLVIFFNNIKTIKSLRLLPAVGHQLGSISDETGKQLATSTWLKGVPAMPCLQKLITEDVLLKEVLSIASPAVIRELALRLPTEVRVLDEITLRHDCLSALAACSSLKELELLLYGEANTRNRCHVVAALHHIPITVERLALRFPNEPTMLNWDYADTNLCFLTPLRRLINLKKINLPWSAVLYHEEDKDEEGYGKEECKSRVTALTSRLATMLPELEYVMFQGSHDRNKNHRPAWSIDWNV